MKRSVCAKTGGGALRIEAKRIESNRLRIRVQDEGSGIPQEHLAHLGEPFYTTKTKGTGLGLMVSKKIIASHKGHLNITSQVGVGTTVDVFLPLC